MIRVTLRRITGALLVVASVLGAGCTFGPRYKRPQIPTPATFRGSTSADVPDHASLGDAKWWIVFKDEELQTLIRMALTESPNIQIAAARVAQAQAQAGTTRADQYPTIAGTGSGGRQRNPSNPLVPAFEANTTQLGLTSIWQLDFWGRYRKATEASRAVLTATEWGQKAVISTLVANVAMTYFELRELDLELLISRRTLTARQESLELNRTLERGGGVSLMDVRQAEILVEQAARRIPEVEKRIQQQENLLSVLLGRSPGEIPRGLALTEQSVPAAIPAGLPSSLLERRPDIRQTEWQLIAANARIGVAKAAWFPQISLTGAAGYQAFSLAGLFDSKVYNVSAGMEVPIFDFGRVRSNVRLTVAQKQELVATYQQTVQQAFREVSDALVAVHKNRDYRGHQQLLQTAAQRAADLANVRYKGGATSYLEVLQSQTDLFDAEIGLAQAHLSERLAVVQVYSALGGGWQE